MNGNYKILIIATDESIRNLFTHIFEEKKFEVIVAPDFDIGLSIGANKKPELLLIDIYPVQRIEGMLLKVHDSYELNSIPVIILVEDEKGGAEALRLFKNKQTDFLVKSNCTLSQIVSEVENKIRGKI